LQAKYSFGLLFAFLDAPSFNKARNGTGRARIEVRLLDCKNTHEAGAPDFAPGVGATMESFAGNGTLPDNKSGCHDLI
jgi:hypothetical protein